MMKIITVLSAVLTISVLSYAGVYSESAKPGTEFSNSLGMKFVYIMPGSFIMGSPFREYGRWREETPHPVILTKGFYMQTTEVTQRQWMILMRDNPSYFRNCDECPVEGVSWDDVQSFIKKLNSNDGKVRYRLPSEAEWEYAARAGTETPFHFGNCLSADQANYDGNYPFKGCLKGKDRQKTVRAGSFPPNAWGLYDMHGNVYEWCQDWFVDYPTSAVTDPTGPATGRIRVLRGGSWCSHRAEHCRSAARYGNRPAHRDRCNGFRLVCDPKIEQ